MNLIALWIAFGLGFLSASILWAAVSHRTGRRDQRLDRAWDNATRTAQDQFYRR